MKDLLQIFYTFFGIGAITFGGGYSMLPLFLKTVAGKHQWATEEEIVDFYSAAQCLPGIIAVNTAMQIGYKKKGVPGLITAAAGMIIPSIIIILIIAAFIGRFLEIAWVGHAFNGIRIAVLALIADAVVNMWKNGVKDVAGLAIFIVSLVIITFIPVTPSAPLITAAVCGIIIKERKRKKAEEP